jgi:hypothetical protein
MKPNRRGHGSGRGRVKGTPNRISRSVKDAVLSAAATLGHLEPVYKRRRQIGWKPGTGGMQGYLIWLGLQYPSAFAQLLAKLLPMQIKAQIDEQLTVSERFTQTELEGMTLPEKMKAMHEMLSLTRQIAPDDKEERRPWSRRLTN